MRIIFRSQIKTTKPVKLNKMKELLEMTHAELILASKEIRTAYTQAVIEDKQSRAINLIAQGYKHIQLENGSIKKIKKDGSYFYATRNGLGTGVNLFVTNVLLDAIKKTHQSGWGDIVSYK